MAAAGDVAFPAQTYRADARFGRGIVLRCILVLLVGASQIGMLVIAAIYVRIGRIENLLSPEAVFGTIAIGLGLLVMRVWPIGRLKDPVLPWLLAFLIYGVVSELLRPDMRLGNVSTLISIAAFYLLGRAIGVDVVKEDGGRLPWTGALIFVYAVWYIGMFVFFLRGDLGFYGELPYSNLSRLQFSDGYRATEIAIHVGFQVPVLLYVLLQVRSAMQRLLSIGLLCSAFLLVLATASSAALVANAIVVVVFIFARIGLSMKTLVISTLGMIVVGVATMTFFSEGIFQSAQAKLEDLSAGEGTRAIVYGELISSMINVPLGIGKGRFVEGNTLSWAGEPIYPHQNFLGIGAELGIPAMLLFLGFVIAAIFVLVKRGLAQSLRIPQSLKMVAAVALAMFLYQQFRGMFQDTWTVRETYFWLGLAMGATSSIGIGREMPTSRDSAE